MRILYVREHIPGPGEPGSSRAFDHLELLTADGFDVEAIAGPANPLTGRPAEALPGVRRLRLLPEPRPFPLRALAQLANPLLYLPALLAACRRADLLLFSTPPLLPGLACALAARAAGIPLVVEWRDLWPDAGVALGRLRRGRLPARLLEAAAAALGRAAAGHVCLTPGIAREISRRHPGTPVLLLPNGPRMGWREQAGGSSPHPPAGVTDPRPHVPFRPSVFPHPRETGGAEGDTGGLEGSRPSSGGAGAAPPPVPSVPLRVAWAGHLTAGNDLAGWLRVAAAARGAATFALAGDGPLRGEVERALARPGMDHVRYAGPLPHREMGAFLSAADLFFLALPEGEPGGPLDGVLPNKLVDAMGAGLPVLLLGGGDAARLLARSGGGVAVPRGPAEVAEAVAALSGLAGDAAWRRMLGEAGRRFVAERLSRERQAARLGVFLRGVFDKRPPRR